MSTALPITMCIKDIPVMLGQLVDVLGGDPQVQKLLSKEHRLYPLFSFYFLNKNKNWEQIDIPPEIVFLCNWAGHLWVFKDALAKAKSRTSLTRFYRQDYIDTFLAEAAILSDYARRGYYVRWSSLFEQDPPDFAVTDRQFNVEVDFELKVKRGRGTIETMFDSVSRGLQSLKRRKPPAERPAVIIVHNPDDLEWEKWLKDKDVQKRLESRLQNPEYSIVSGIIFSGGDYIMERDGGGQCFTRYLAYTSLIAKYKLPEGLLTSAVGL